MRSQPRVGSRVLRRASRAVCLSERQIRKLESFPSSTRRAEAVFGSFVEEYFEERLIALLRIFDQRVVAEHLNKNASAISVAGEHIWVPVIVKIMGFENAI